MVKNRYNNILKPEDLFTLYDRLEYHDDSDLEPSERVYYLQQICQNGIVEDTSTIDGWKTGI